MKEHVLERSQWLPRGREDVFGFFADAFNLQAITPAWLHFRVLTPAPVTMAPGALLAYRLRLHGLPLRWLTRIEAWEPPVRFVDVQVRGPYRLWHHTHSFEPDGDGTLIRDRVRYALPFGDLAHPFVRRDLDRIFAFRHAAVREALQERSASARAASSSAWRNA